MIDIKALREDPDRFRKAIELKGANVDVNTLFNIDADRRGLTASVEAMRAEQNRFSKEVGPELGRLKNQLKSVTGPEHETIENRLKELERRPVELKQQAAEIDRRLTEIELKWKELMYRVPQLPAADVPVGAGPEDNKEIRRWNAPNFDPAKSFQSQRGFKPKTHLELVRDLGLVDFERGVKMAGTRQYVLTGLGMKLHLAVLRYAFDFITEKRGFTAMGVPVIVREECMLGTGFFPFGREQAYHIEESKRGAGHDLFLTGTGEVGLMGFHADEIIPVERLPLKYTTQSTCFRREAGSAGKDTAGLYRIHQFDKVEQVVICRADDAESRGWHKHMLETVEILLQGLSLPYRLLQCCTGDLGMKNEDMIDVECWMPGRGNAGPDGVPTGEWGETHSASRLGDYQCRRLNLRYRDSDGKIHFAWALNNTVIASPRVLIPILELNQNNDGSVTVPEALRGHMGGLERITPR